MMNRDEKRTFSRRPNMTETPPADSGGATLHDRVAQALDTIRPFLQQDGGDIDLVNVDDQGVVQVRFRGACIGCPSAAMTLTQGVERTLREKVPEVTKVTLA
jgi:Fe-S cluster biogenesis protein NfuA